MLRNNRIMFLGSSSLQDLSLPLSDISRDDVAIPYASPDDFIFLGSDLPFNHRHFEIKEPNAVAATVSVRLWNGHEWIAAVDVLDDTSVGGVPLARSGIISWQPEKDEHVWCFDDTDEMTGSGLETGPKIFGLYWARLAFSASLTATTALSYVGHRFCPPELVEANYPELADINEKTAWKPGKTSWADECLLASEQIIQHLRGKKDLIRSPSQILDPWQFAEACSHKAAEIIFRGKGKDHAQDMIGAMNAYSRAINVGKFNVDNNANATLDDGEKVSNIRHGFR